LTEVLERKCHAILSGRKGCAKENAKRRVIACHDAEVCIIWWSSHDVSAIILYISAVVNYVVD
jgi:hypothetical protein